MLRDRLQQRNAGVLMSSAVAEYFDALDRLKKGRPDIVPRGTKITNDSVALEAGRKKGTIKKSRPVFQALITAIDEAAKLHSLPRDEAKVQLQAAKDEAAKYRGLWEEALCREVSLAKQLWDERQEWARKEAALTGAKVTSINARRRQGTHGANASGESTLPNKGRE